MDDKSHHVQKRFPDKGKAVRLLLAREPEFRIVCQDYGDCILALQFWQQSTASEAETRVKEYRTLVEELEKEIVEALAAADRE